MDEAIVEKMEPVVEKTEETAPETAPVVVDTPLADAKKKGRPAGAKDKAPRKKKPTIVEEQIVSEAPAPITRSVVEKPVRMESRPPLPPPSTPEFVEEPPSPRTMMREASRNILQLRTLTDMARKTYLHESYTKRLHTLQ